MKNPALPPDSRWDALLQRARADAPAPVNASALLATVRAAHQETAPVAPAGLFAELSALLGTTRMITACAGGAGVFCLAAAWLAWTVADQLYPWAQLVSLAAGGLS